MKQLVAISVVLAVAAACRIGFDPVGGTTPGDAPAMRDARTLPACTGSCSCPGPSPCDFQCTSPIGCTLTCPADVACTLTCPDGVSCTISCGSTCGDGCDHPNGCVGTCPGNGGCEF